MEKRAAPPDTTGAGGFLVDLMKYAIPAIMDSI